MLIAIALLFSKMLKIIFIYLNLALLTTKMSGASAIIIGGTGKIGKELVRELSNSEKFEKVRVLVRKSRGADFYSLSECGKKIMEEVVVDYDNLNAEDFKGFTHGYSTLGTTRKDAGSAEAFKKVDLTYNVNSAKLMKQGGTRHMHLVSSQGANANGWLLYTKTKGECENAFRDMNFESLSVWRPGLLAGRGSGRAVESIGNAVTPNCFRVHVRTVARAMYYRSFKSADKFLIIENAAIKKGVEEAGGKDALFDKI